MRETHHSRNRALDRGGVENWEVGVGGMGRGNLKKTKKEEEIHSG